MYVVLLCGPLSAIACGCRVCLGLGLVGASRSIKEISRADSIFELFYGPCKSPYIGSMSRNIDRNMSRQQHQGT